MKKVIALVGMSAFASTLLWYWATNPDTNQPGTDSFSSDTDSTQHSAANSEAQTESGLAGLPTPGTTALSSPFQDADLSPLMSPDSPARPDQITLWKVSASNAGTAADGFPATLMHTNPALLDTLHVGQELTIDIPGLVQPVITRIESTHNQLNSIQVFNGPILNQGDHANVIITRGQDASYVIVSTNESVWSAVIDHQTGETLLVDERDILLGLAHEDMVPVPRVDLEPPNRGQLNN